MHDTSIHIYVLVIQNDFTHSLLYQVHACLGLLAQSKVLCTDQMRRTLEGMELGENYSHLDYYSRWTIAMANLCIEAGVFSEVTRDGHAYCNC